MMALAGTVIAAACCASQLFADNPPAANPPAAAPAADPFVKKNVPDPAAATGPQANLIFTFEFYELGQAEGAELLQESGTDQAHYDHLRDLVKQGKARLDALMGGAQADGQQVALQQYDLFAYPIAYVFSSSGKMARAGDFKRRNLGYRLITKAQCVEGNKACDISMFPEHTRLRGFVDQSTSLGAVLSTVPQPVFETQRINTKPPILPFDQIRLLGTFNPPAANWTPPTNSQPTQPGKDSEMGLLFAHASRVQYDPGAVYGDKFQGVDLEMTVYSMDRDQALRILSQPQQPGLAYEGVQSLLKASQAKLEHMAVIRTQVGLKSNCSEISEDIYPTGGNDQWISQDVGFSAEIRPELIGNGSIVSLDVTQFQFLNDRGPLQAAGLAGSLVASQPIFELQSITTKINAAVGEHALLGTINPAGDTGINGTKDDGRVWLAFVRPTLVNP
jgi:hypothetical protein